MKIISINAGSSTLKFSLFNMDTKEVIVSGNFERIGMEGSFYSIKYDGNKVKIETALKDHGDAVRTLLEKLVDLNIVDTLEEIDGIGHRVVHGGDKYSKSVMITDEVLEDIVNYTDLAPLHNPANAIGIKVFKEALPRTPMVAVFDTAFHQTIEKERFLYPVPYNWYREYGIRKYGFHGTSHRYVALKMQEYLKKEDISIIACHLGNGASCAAIHNGKSIDTSMGFTPNSGLMMGTRAGDIDATVIPFVMEKEGKSVGEIMNDLNKNSGLYGVSEFSSDARDIEQGIAEGKEQCILAREMFANSIVKYIAQYYVELGKVDAICFMAGIGERDQGVRSLVAEKLAAFGIKLDIEANIKAFGEFGKITTKDSSIPMYVVPTDEELMIAMDTYELINR